MKSHVLADGIRRRPQRRAQAGFTLVELITVMVILGVLAAVALPRYADLQGKARIAKVKAIAGSITAAAGLAKASAMANSVSCTTTATATTLEGTSIALNYCYPQGLGALTTGILAAANVSAADNWVVDGTVSGGAAAGAQVQINLSDAGTPATCAVQYTGPATAAASPVVAVLTAGC